MSAAKSAQTKKRLRLYSEQPPKNPRSLIEAVASLPDLLDAFDKATGWSLRYMGDAASKVGGSAVELPIHTGRGLPPSHLRLEAHVAEEKKAKGGVARKSAETLAASIADMLGELLQTRHALWQREAELAAGVPTVPHREEEKHLAARLESVLKGGAEAVGCDAAALYLLDEGTSELKLRSSWGLPFDRLTLPARPLKGAIADLEALLGHAVVLDDAETMHIWNVPEDFPTAVCVPVASPTTLLGTLWVFGGERRDINDRQTNILEVVAGRLASDLEREMLLRESVDGAELKKQLASAERLQRSGLPTIAPMLDSWDVAGCTQQAQGLGGAFHDWFCLPDGLLAVAVGRAQSDGIAASLTANAVRTSLRARRAILSPGGTRFAATESDPLDQFGGRPTRGPLLRADRNGDRPGLHRHGRTPLGPAAPPQRLGIAQPPGKPPRPKPRGRFRAVWLRVAAGRNARAVQRRRLRHTGRPRATARRGRSGQGPARQAEPAGGSPRGRGP